MLQSSGPLFNQQPFQHTLSGQNAENIPNQQPNYWHDVPVHEQRAGIHDYKSSNRNNHPLQDMTTSHHPPMHDFGETSFGMMDTGLNSTSGNDSQMELHSLFPELHQDSSFPQQASLPRRRSRYRLRRQGQEVRPVQIPVSEPSPNRLQRWQDSLPDEEAAPMAAIMNALDLPENQLLHSGSSINGEVSDARHRKSRSVASSNNSSRSSGTSRLSGTSDRSTGSINLNSNARARGPRRRRVEKP